MAISKERKEQLKFLKPLVEDILLTDIEEYISYVTLTMKIKRGQGKRIKGMVKGGMGSWYGSEPRKVVNFSKYSQDLNMREKRSLSVQYSCRWEFYLKAREYGLNNEMAYAFAMFYSVGTLKCQRSIEILNGLKQAL